MSLVASPSCSSEYTGSTFSETVISDGTLFGDTPLDQSKPRVRFPPASPYVSPTYEEEAALFMSAGTPSIRLPSFTSVFNIAATATAARQKLTISSKRDFPEDEARVEPGELFDGIIRVCLPKQHNYVSPTAEEEKDLFNGMTRPVIRLPSIISSIHTQPLPHAAHNTFADDFHTPLDIETRAEVENKLFDDVIRVHFPAPQYIDIAPTAEEEKELFTRKIAPIIQLPSFTMNALTKATASTACKAISICSSCNFAQDIGRQEPEDLFDGIVRVGVPDTAAQPDAGKDVSESEEAPGEALFAAPTSSIAPKQQSISPPKLVSRLNAEASDFVPEMQLESKTSSALLHTDSKLNPLALRFVPEKQYLNSTLNAEAPAFVPGEHPSTSMLNPEAPVFVPDQRPALTSGNAGCWSVLNPKVSASSPPASLVGKVQPQVLGYTVGASDFVPVASPSLNPEASVFYLGERQKTLFNPEAAEFIPTPNPARYLQNARSTLPDLTIATTTPSISPQCYEDRREAWLTEELFNYGLDNFGEGMAVHHYSFIGHPVMCKTSTPPATSLAIISGKPKLKEGYLLNQDDLHRHAMLYNAMHLVDPVVYRGSADLLYDLKGTELENAVIGLVNKAYSGHGYWQGDHYDDYDDVPEYDPLNVHQYDEDEMYFNATSRLYYLTQPQPPDNVDDPVNEAKRKQTRREDFTCVKSRLSQMVSADNCDDVQVDDRPMIVGKQGIDMAEAKPDLLPEPEIEQLVRLTEDRSDLQQANVKSAVSDVEEDTESEADSTGTIRPECAVSPLKIRKPSIQPLQDIDVSLEISPLKLRKPSDDSTSSGHADDSPTGNTSDESGISTPATADSGDDPVENSSTLADLASSLDETMEKVQEKEKSLTWTVVSKPSTSRALIGSQASKPLALHRGSNAGGESIPIASALRPNRGGSQSNSADPFRPLQDAATRLNQYLIRNDDPWDPLDPSVYARSGIPRSPECNNLKRAVTRPDLVRGDEYKIIVLSDPLPVPELMSEQQPCGVLDLSGESDQEQSVAPIPSEESDKEQSDVFKSAKAYEMKTHMPHQLSPIKEVSEESPNTEFFHGATRSIKEIGEVGGHNVGHNAPLKQSSSPVRPRPMGLKRHATVSNLRGVAEKQDDYVAVTATPGSPPMSPRHDGSPIKRPSAPTPSRMRRLPEPESDDEDKESQASVSDELDEPLTSPTSEDSLVNEPRSGSVVSGCESLIRSPKGKQVEDLKGLGNFVSPSPLAKVKQVFGSRVSSGTWLSGKIIQGSAPQPDSDSDEAPGPIIPPSTTIIAEPVTSVEQAVRRITPGAAPPSQAGLALPYYPPPPTVAEPCMSLLSAPGTVYVAPPVRFGSAVQAFFNRGEAVEPSPSRSVMERVFKDFSGFHAAALDFGEFSVDFAETVKEDMVSTGVVSSAIESQLPPHRTWCLDEDAPMTEDMLPSSPRPASEASVSSSTTSITFDETVIHTFAVAKAQEQQRSGRAVLFNRMRRPDGPVRPTLRSSSWGKVENKLQKKSGGAAALVASAMNKDVKKEVKKGRLAKWADRVFGRGKGKQ